MTNLHETQKPLDRQTAVNPASHNQLQSILEVSNSGGGSGEDSPMSTSTTTGEDSTPSLQLTGEDSEVKSDVDSTTTMISVNESEESLASPPREEESRNPQEGMDQLYKTGQDTIPDMMRQEQVHEQDTDEIQPQTSSIVVSPSRVPVITFPLADMARLDEMISNPRWVVPVLPGGHLETLLAASIDLATRGFDEKCEPCQRFYREGLTISFTKILTDDAVSSWKPEIHKAILKNCERLVDLMVVKLRVDWFPLFDLMSTLFNPTNKFHMFNANRQPETYSPDIPVSDDELFARPIEMRQCKGWLVDLINRFGSQGGFDLILKRFTNPAGLNVSIIFSLLRPFGRCAEFLTRHTVEKYFAYILTAVPQILENLSDDELKKETAKSDIISSVIKCLKALQSRSTESEEHMKSLELFRLRMILRMLQVSSFNGKMNALNEINQVIQNVTSHYTSHHYRLDEVEYLTSKNIADWFAENQVLQIVLRDSLHQPQYVEKMEKILRFIIKERSLSLKDLDDIWAAQVGKHDTIVKNVHDLLAKLAWDFSPDQLDHLFECFQTSWTTANKRQREKLLELIRRLAEDDKDGVMAYKVLTLFWNLAQSTEVPTEIMDQALTAHVKVLDYSCSQQRDNQKFQWLNKSMDKLIEDDVSWVIPAMKHMNEIFCLYPEGSATNKNPATTYRAQIINKLQNDRQLIVKVCESLNSYLEKVRAYVKDKGILDPHQVKLDGRYSHLDQIKERLTFLLSFLKAGELCLCEEQANSIWHCLAENPAFSSDREMCFEWFSKLMNEPDPDLDPSIIQPFFERKILNFDPTLLTECGLECFERFFKFVNIRQQKLVVNKRDEISMDDLELTGTDYIWKIILCGSEDMASKAICFLRQICTALGPKLLPNQVEVHDDFLSSCSDRLKASYDTILVLERDKDSTNRVRQEVTRACRVLRVLFEYVVECDAEYGEERAFIPLYRASRGKNFVIYIRFPGPSGRGFDDMEVLTHTNETPAGLRRQIIRQVKEQMQINSGFKLDVFYNGEIIDLSDDRRTVHQFGLRDKMVMQAKLVHSNVPNSPDSSEESSGGSPNHFTSGTDGPNADAEESLPSVMMSMCEKRMPFLCKLCELGANIGEDRLRDAARLNLSVLPPCRFTVKSLKEAFLTATSPLNDKKPYNLMFNTDPATVLYRLEVLYALLFPAVSVHSSQTLELLQKFFIAGGASMVVEMLTKNNFMPLADTATKRSAYLAVLKLTKAILTITSHLLFRYESEGNTPARSERLRIVSEAVKAIPSPGSEITLRQTAERVSHGLFTYWKSSTPDPLKEGLKLLLVSAVEGSLPDLETVRLLIKLASSAATGSLAYLSSEQHQANREPTDDDIAVCEEALETLTLSFVMNPGALEQVINDQMWRNFVRQVLFHSHSILIRAVAAQQFYSIATKCTGNVNALNFFTIFLFEIIQNSVREMPQNSMHVFQLLCNLLRYSHTYSVPMQKHELLLTTQIDWLRQAKEYVKRNGEGCLQEDLLEGHICVARELTNFLIPEKKYELGCDPSGNTNSLIREILEEFVFPWSKAYSHMRRTGEISFESPIQVCSNPNTQVAILELLVSLCTGSNPNLKLTVDILTQLFGYSLDGEGTLNEWEYFPPVGSRPMGGFVGLKNAGATCYMNSVLQQLFMVDPIKRGVLGVTDSDSDSNDDGVDDTTTRDSTDSVALSQTSLATADSNTDDRKVYNVCILKQIQSIFGHLALSKFQYHIPVGLWKQFRLQGEPVNLREQQDAVEFFMSLVESVDDGLKAVGEEQVMSKNLGGLFSDQKICKECPHRYSKEEPFSVISVDIRNHSNLLDSLEQYVKGELLEGADAYHCERCNKKVVTVKRLCVKKLPPVLAIQLKRFEYDYERVCPIKFNDYFEFPRELDMEPYTVSGLAKIEGEMIDQDDAALLGQNVCTKFRLTGIVVHSGQASGGHYYSYISFRCHDGMWRWYKFDDGDVSECRMDDDEELKNQCFGGDYSGEVFDHMMKRMSFRRQKRWWNAYILFYTRSDVFDTAISAKLSTLPNLERRLKMPAAIERSVLKENVEFMHVRSHFSPEYFQFVKKLVAANHHLMPTNITIEAPNEEVEQLALLSVQLATQFLFSIGFRTKKNLRGIANDWYEFIMPYMRVSKTVRSWFATHALFVDSCRFGEYLLECPSSEVRQTFSKLLIYLCHCSKNDGTYQPSVPMATLSRRIEKEGQLWEYILEAILQLLRRELSEYGRHLVQYFGFFVAYANLGDKEKANLLKLEVPETFMLLALDDGPAPPIKYQCADLGKLHQTVSLLVRSCDVSELCKSAVMTVTIGPNPFRVETQSGKPIMALPRNLEELLYRYGDSGCNPYIKKLIEEAYTSEDTITLLQFLCWENLSFSEIAVMEVLSRIGFSYTTDLKAFLDLLISILRIDDSWQSERIASALKGLPDEKDGLIDIIHRNKTSHPKRAYLFIKCVTNLMEPNSIAHNVLVSVPDLMTKWNAAVNWLQHELERRAPACSSAYGYSTTSWSPPSNESSNGSFFLERSLSAKHTLERALELRIDPDQVENEEDQISSEGEDGSRTTVEFESDKSSIVTKGTSCFISDNVSDARRQAKPKSRERDQLDKFKLKSLAQRGYQPSDVKDHIVVFSTTEETKVEPAEKADEFLSKNYYKEFKDPSNGVPWDVSEAVRRAAQVMETYDAEETESDKDHVEKLKKNIEDLKDGKDVDVYPFYKQYGENFVKATEKFGKLSVLNASESPADETKEAESKDQTVTSNTQQPCPKENDEAQLSVPVPETSGRNG